MLKPVLSLQLPVKGKTYGRYLRMEVTDASPDALADAVRRMVEEPDAHEIGLPYASSASHLGRKQRAKKNAEQEDDSMVVPGI